MAKGKEMKPANEWAIGLNFGAEPRILKVLEIQRDALEAAAQICDANSFLHLEDESCESRCHREDAHAIRRLKP